MRRSSEPCPCSPGDPQGLSLPTCSSTHWHEAAEWGAREKRWVCLALGVWLGGVDGWHLSSHIPPLICAWVCFVQQMAASTRARHFPALRSSWDLPGSGGWVQVGFGIRQNRYFCGLALPAPLGPHRCHFL